MTHERTKEKQGDKQKKVKCKHEWRQQITGVMFIRDEINTFAGYQLKEKEFGKFFCIKCLEIKYI